MKKLLLLSMPLFLLGCRKAEVKDTGWVRVSYQSVESGPHPHLALEFPNEDYRTFWACSDLPAEVSGKPMVRIFYSGGGEKESDCANVQNIKVMDYTCEQTTNASYTRADGSSYTYVVETCSPVTPKDKQVFFGEF